MGFIVWFCFVVPIYCVIIFVYSTSGIKRPAAPPPLRPSTPAELQHKQCFDEAMAELDEIDRHIIYGIIAERKEVVRVKHVVGKQGVYPNPHIMYPNPQSYPVPDYVREIECSPSYVITGAKKRGCEMNSLQITETWSDLFALLNKMDVPAERRIELRWLAHNLHVLNHESEHYEPAMDLIRKLLRDIDQEIKRMG